ncbi:Dual specificity protein kinase shkE [Diplonema papillatum]|nr:Dual specificity protein kinase shkE [Diplonema papillatum]
MGCCAAKQDESKQNPLEELRNAEYQPPNKGQQDDQVKLLQDQVAQLASLLQKQEAERALEKEERAKEREHDAQRQRQDSVSSDGSRWTSRDGGGRRRKGSRRQQQRQAQPPPPPPEEDPDGHSIGHTTTTNPNSMGADSLGQPVNLFAPPGGDSGGAPPPPSLSEPTTTSPVRPKQAPPPPIAPPLPMQEQVDFTFESRKYNYNDHTDAPPPDPERPNGERVRTLLLIGETGSGKSTLINAMANYAAGVQYNDKWRYRLVDEPERDQSQSQTQTVTSYHVWCPQHSFTLRLIDTPGFGDTSGVERDEAITKDIYEFLQKEDEIHGVCFVAAASLPRLTVTQQYIINKVLTMFGTDAVENIYLLVTFADGKRAQVLSAIKASGFPYNENHGFHFNNSALFAQGADRNEYSRNFWQMGQHSLEKFFLNLSSKEPFNLGKTKDVIATQKKLQNYVASITPQVTIGLSKIDNLKKILDDIKVNRDKINENKDYYYSETIPKVERLLKQPGTYNTQCLKCSYNCHHDCTRSNDDDKQYCCAMDNDGHCSVCPDKCHWRDHANLDYYFEWSTQVVDRQYDTKKLQLTAAKDGLSRSEALKSSVLQELQEVYDTVHNLMTSIHEAHAKLDKIALRPTNLRFVDYLRLLIEQEKLHKRPGFQGRMEQLHIMLDQANIRDGIVSKKYDPITEWKKNVEDELGTLAEWQAPLPDPNDVAARGEMEEDGSSTEEVSVVTEVDIAGAASPQVSSWNGTTAEKSVVFGSPALQSSPAVASHAGRRRQPRSTFNNGSTVSAGNATPLPPPAPWTGDMSPVPMTPNSAKYATPPPADGEWTAPLPHIQQQQQQQQQQHLPPLGQQHAPSYKSRRALSNPPMTTPPARPMRRIVTPRASIVPTNHVIDAVL